MGFMEDSFNNNDASSEANDGLPQEVKMRIHTGMLESLGINMYTSIGKSLVEFIANGFDAEATLVKVDIPFEDIESARLFLKDRIKKDKANQKKIGSVYDPIRDDVVIVVEDNGHGMTAQEIEDKFLVINRPRRKEGGNKSESGLRSVMGRKGLGKLAGFGVAEQVVVRSKRKGETYATEIIMNFNEIQKFESVGNVSFIPKYETGLDSSSQGTTITLSKLRCDSLKYKLDAIQNTLSQNFYITGHDFTINLNGDKLNDPNIDYEFTYPPERPSNGFGSKDVDVNGLWNYPIEYVVKFRARGKSSDGVIRGSLPAHQRGARVYCNQRLAAGPDLFSLDSGMHNFHAQSYMECIVHADVLDDQEADLIGTNRSALKSDNEVVEAFTEAVTAVMKDAIYAHSKYRDQVVENEIQNDPTSKAILGAVSQLPAKTRKPAKLLLTTLAAREGVDSEVYKEIAPHFVQAINSSEIIIELIKSGSDPSNIGTVIDQLIELAEIEKNDVIKLYRARRYGIDALYKLEERSHGEGMHGPKYENELQETLKRFPWLIRPEYSGHLTSDSKMGEVLKKLNSALKIDDHSGEIKIDDQKRPDLVFLLSDQEHPSQVEVVELKSPNVPLESKHLDQLEGYMEDVENIVRQDHNRSIKVYGYLIGNKAHSNSKAEGVKSLNRRIGQAGPTAKWEVLAIPEMLERTRKVHVDVVAALEEDDLDQD